MVSSVENGFRPGMDKHAAKKQNKETDYKIYSFASRKELISFCHRFTDFMKEKFPDVRKVKDIEISHINSYLASKTNVTQKTIQHEISCINKMQLCCNKKFGISVDWKTDRIVPKVNIQTRRNIVFSDEQMVELKKYFNSKRDSHSKTAFFIGERFALRASEIEKLQKRDFRENDKILHIHDSKGKRSRDIPLSDSDIVFLRKITKGLSNGDRIVPIRADSICAALNRACKALGYKEIVAAKSSYHCLRKYVITKRYKEEKTIIGMKKARENCMEYLGHSRNRKDLFSTYIKE